MARANLGWPTPTQALLTLSGKNPIDNQRMAVIELNIGLGCQHIRIIFQALQEAYHFMKSNQWATGVTSTRLVSLMSGPIPMAKICFLANCIRIGMVTLGPQENSDRTDSTKAKLNTINLPPHLRLPLARLKSGAHCPTFKLGCYALPSPTPPEEPWVVIVGLLENY